MEMEPMTALWVVGGIAAWIAIAVALGRAWFRLNPNEDKDVVVILSLGWPIMLPTLIFFSPIIVGGWLITRPTKAERLKAKREVEEREARWRAQDIARLERELGVIEPPSEPLP
jgi:hypothetical protein